MRCKVDLPAFELNWRYYLYYTLSQILCGKYTNFDKNYGAQDKNAALIMASSNGDVCIVDALLRRGAHINHKDQVCLKEARKIYSVLGVSNSARPGQTGRFMLVRKNGTPVFLLKVTRIKLEDYSMILRFDYINSWM